MLERWGGFVARRALAVLLAGMALTVAAAVYGFGVFDSLSTGGFDDPDSEAYHRARGRGGRLRQPLGRHRRDLLRRRAHR